MRKVWFVFSFCLYCLIFLGCAEGSAGSEIVLAADVNGGEEISEKEPAVSEQPQTASQEEPAVPEPVVIHVCGAVRNEGVYTLPAGCRVYEAVAAAGGFSEDADTAAVNQAQILTDGIRLRIPTQEESSALAESAGSAETVTAYIDGGTVSVSGDSAASAGGRININTADEKTLCQLNGVGPGTAAKIIAYREQNGGFKVIEDIMKVPGIKEKIFSKIKDDITV